jgi:hypothetical protein
MSEETKGSGKEDYLGKESANKGAAARSTRKGPRSKKKKDEAVVELTEEEKAIKEVEKRKKYILERCTLLQFIMLDKTEREVLCEGERCELYTDLQRLVAKKTPRSLQIFIIQDHETGVIMTSENFKHTHSYRVKEMANRKLEATAKSRWRPQVDPRWEFYDYHAGAPPGWVDPIEEEKKRKARLEREAKERKKAEEDAEKVLARLGGDSDDSDDGGDPFA